MLVGAYPFEDPDDPQNFKKTINVSYLNQLKYFILLLFYFIN